MSFDKKCFDYVFFNKLFFTLFISSFPRNFSENQGEDISVRLNTDESEIFQKKCSSRDKCDNKRCLQKKSSWIYGLTRQIISVGKFNFNQFSFI